MTTTRKAVILTLLTTVLTATGQTLFKMAGSGFSFSLEGLLRPTLILGMVTYALAAAILVLAFREGELSTLYPIISMSYVWVGIIGVVYFHELLRPVSMVGMVLIIGGVSLMGVGGRA